MMDENMLGGKNMIYDYRLKDTANELTQTFDSLNGHELEQVSNFILQMKSEEAAERKHSRTEYIQNALTMILQNYAAETCSILEVHETGQEVHMTLKNEFGFILDDVKEIKMAMLLADSVVIDEKDGIVRMQMVYSC